MALLDDVATAIDAADPGYSIRLKTLTDEGAIYALDLRDGSEPLMFPGWDEACEHATRHRSLARARAAIAILRPEALDDFRASRASTASPSPGAADD